MSLLSSVVNQESQRRSYQRIESGFQIVQAVLLKHPGDR